jgi:hypothetical protein
MVKRRGEMKESGCEEMMRIEEGVREGRGSEHETDLIQDSLRAIDSGMERKERERQQGDERW